MLCLCFAPLGGGAEEPPASAALTLQPEVAVQYASREEAVAALTQSDRFTRALSRFDLESRVGRRDVTLPEYLEFVSGEAVDWQAPERAKVAAVFGRVAAQVAPLQAPFPSRILLIQTTGKEEGGAAYCRGAAIVLPRPLVRKATGERLERLLIHELFHVLSANHARLRQALYEQIGFRHCGEVPLPDGMRERKLTNPDGPGLADYISLDERRKAVPLLYSSVQRYDPDQPGPFFKFLVFRLMEIHQDDQGSWQPVVRDGQLVLTEAAQEPGFMRQVGENTKYLLHPDEILADNFVFLAQGTRDLKSPEVVSQMRETIRKWSGKKGRQ